VAALVAMTIGKLSTIQECQNPRFGWRISLFGPRSSGSCLTKADKLRDTTQDGWLSRPTLQIGDICVVVYMNTDRGTWGSLDLGSQRRQPLCCNSEERSKGGVCKMAPM
jgi:hypothetical protein